MNDKSAERQNDQLLCRIRGEYQEMPGLRLTEPQARRLWGLDRAACAHVLEALTESRFLCRTEDGTYVRVSDELRSSRRSA